VLCYNRYGYGKRTTKLQGFGLAFGMIIQVHYFVLVILDVEVLLDHGAVGTGIRREDSNILDHRLIPPLEYILVLATDFVYKELYNSVLLRRQYHIYCVFYVWLLLADAKKRNIENEVGIWRNT